MENTPNSTRVPVPQPDTAPPSLPKSQIDDCKTWVTQFEKARKSLRLYKPNHEISNQMERTLTEKLTSYLEAWGRTDLVIRQTAILLGGHPVFQSEQAAGSLSFVFFRDGIHEITFLPGLTRKEIHDFLILINQAAVAVNDESDLATKLWERDFQFVRYVAVDTLSEVQTAPRVADQLASGTIQAPAVSVADLAQPAVYLPTDECRLSDEELENISAQLVDENERSAMESILLIAAELLELEPSDEERRNVRLVLLRTTELQLKENPTMTLGALLRFFDMAENTGDSESIQNLKNEILSLISKPQNIDAVLENMPGSEEAPPGLLNDYLCHLDPASAPALLERLAKIQNPAHRRAASNAVASFGASAMEATRAFAKKLEDPIPSVIIRELLHITGKLGSSASAQTLRTFLGSSDEVTRLTVAQSLDRYQTGPVGEAWRSLMKDPSATVRSTTLERIKDSGHPDLVPDLQAMVAEPDFPSRPIDDKRRIFAAVAHLAANNEGAGWLASQVQPARRRWFARRRDRESSLAAAEALAGMRGNRAADALSQLKQSGDRVARSVCREL